MIRFLPELLSADTVRQARDLLLALPESDWADGRGSAGPQARTVKDNLQLPHDCEAAQAIRNLVLRGLGTDLQWVSSFLVQMLALSAGQFSLLPGGAGAAELTSATLLTPMVGKSTAAAAILIWRVVTYYFYLVVGGPVFVCLLGKPLLERLRLARR